MFFVAISVPAPAQAELRPPSSGAAVSALFYGCVSPAISLKHGLDSTDSVRHILLPLNEQIANDEVIMKKLLILFCAGVVLRGAAVAAPFDENLLVNSTATSSDMTGWTVTANGGSGWSVGSGVFYTSYQWDVRTQTIDLLAAGFSAAVLDASPDINVGVNINAYWGGQYFINCQIQDASHNVLATYSAGSQSSPITLTSSLNNDFSWVGTTLSDYASGARYIVYTDGGKDTRGWSGQYGTRFKEASVSVVPEPATVSVLSLGALVLGLYRRFYRKV